MDTNDKIKYGEKALICAIIEVAIEDFLNMADDPVARKSVHFETAEKFLFDDEPIKRNLLRDPKTSESLSEDTDHYVDCTLEYLCGTLNIDNRPLDVNVIRVGVLKKLERQRNEENPKVYKNRWTPNKNRTIQKGNTR